MYFFQSFGTVEATLLNHKQGSKIVEAARKPGSFSESERRKMIKILVDELSKVHADR